jgi:MbtH protein
MMNPFDDENAAYYALINAEGQYSLWPAFAAIPKGWTAVYGSGSRTACLQYIERHWVDMRPVSLGRRKIAIE